MRTLLILALLAVPAAGGEDVAALARNVKDYPTKFKLIKIGRPAIPPLMAQLSSRDGWLVFESRSALHWIANQTRDREGVAHDIAPYCAKTQPTAVREFAAELLGDLGVSAAIGTLAIMNSDGAVDALRRIPDPRALIALIEMLRVAPAELRGRIYRALGARKDARALPVLTGAAKAGNQAAVAALGEAGFDSSVGVLTELRAFDALVRIGTANALTHAYQIAGDDTQRLAVLYAARRIERLDTPLTPVVREAARTPVLRAGAQHALLSMGAGGAAILREAGDPSVVIRALAACKEVGPIAGHLDSSNMNIRTTAIHALRGVEGRKATDVLLAAARKESDPLALRVFIDVFGARGDPAAAGALEGWMVAAEGEGGLKAAALAAFVRIAGVCPPDRARTMYVRALQAGAIRAAFVGLSRVGDASSLPAIEKAIAAEGAVEALVAIAGRLADAGDRDDAVRAYRKALDAGAPVENRLRLLGEAVEITARGGVVSAWWVIGPFPAPNEGAWSVEEFPENGVDLEADHKINDEAVRWAPVQTGDQNGIVDLDRQFEPHDQVTAYAYAEVVVKKDRPAVLKMGSDDGMRCWLNGKLVHSNLVLRGVKPDEDTVNVQLQEGSNTLLVKVCEMRGGFGFCLRIEDDKGRPLKFKIR